MPIIIKDFNWNQTENTLTIKIPLRSVHPSKCDVLYTKCYIKASFEQYFFEAFLSHEIDPKRSVCTLTPKDIVFELIKYENQFWEQLEANIPKAKKQVLKLQYLEEEYKRIQEQSEEAKNIKHKLKKVAVSEQIDIDESQRNQIAKIKDVEKSNALKDLKVWKKPKKTLKKPELLVSPQSEVVSSVPPPRACATLSVDFTPREFTTPCRESKLSEEEEWLRKQAEARRSVGFISEDLRPEEHNPQFLKEKGDEFFRNHNFLAAVSAYSFGITLNNKLADLYVGRAHAHLALGKLFNSKFINLMRFSRKL